MPYRQYFRNKSEFRVNLVVGCHDINLCKNGLCWNVPVNSNKIIGVLSQTFFFLNNIRVSILASMAYE